MALNYKKGKGLDGQDSMWTSYSDLFLGLSVVFLLLYVTASLRQGTDGIKQHLEYQKLVKENEDIRQQLKVYSTLKQDYLEKEASTDEKETYQELMDKLSLLQEDAKAEKNKLQAEAMENDKKEKALNKYQQVIRNIITANMLAKSRIKNRDSMIENQGAEITDLQKSVQEKKSQIASGEAKMGQLEKALTSKLKQLKASYKNNEISKRKFEEQQAKIKKQAESQLTALKSQNAAAESELRKMNSELAATKGALTQAQGKSEQLASALKTTEGKYKATSAELAKANENLNAKKHLAAQISSNFKKYGIKADVDPKSGDVVLAFGNQYFERDSANLKEGMKKILEQAVPVYSASLFEDKKISEKIANVEIVGFASPTFRGKYVDPSSLNPSDRTAVNYNLDLSYSRARSIFNHIFDQNKMSFKYQQKLLPLVKVTGRSFLDQADRGVAAESSEDFCKKNDCAKLQRVIIKFNLKD